MKQRSTWQMIFTSAFFLLASGYYGSAQTPSARNKTSAVPALSGPGNGTPAAIRKPNIVLILADDLGYSDLGCYGGEVKTPNLDALAARGLRFRRFYNISRCCPTRASLLTGLYNHQAGIGEMTEDRHLPGYRGHLTENTVTLAEVLKSAGYQTAMSGKWHVSNTEGQPKDSAQLRWLDHQARHPYFSPVSQYPVNRGFDRYFGNIWGVVDYFDPFSLVSGTTPIDSVPKGYYHTDAINDTAVAYIHAMSNGKPFFLYVAETAPHWPLMAPEAEITKYKDVYTAGWDSIRAARYRRMTNMGLIDTVTTRLSPRLHQNSWADNPDKEWDARAMAVHAAMIDRMDQGIGRIINALKETGQLDNTIVIFLSDNGASPENAARFGPGFDRPAQTRDGRTIYYPVKKDSLPGAETVYGSIGVDWANVANTPYRYAKAESYEGGVRTPMIVSWPAGIKARGSYSDYAGHVMDFMPTLIAISGASYPAHFNEHNITPYTGVSFLPALQGKKEFASGIICNEHYKARYARAGDWKLVSLSADSTWRLYNLRSDASETKNVATLNPAIVKRLSAAWFAWANTHAVLPKQGRKESAE